MIDDRSVPHRLQQRGSKRLNSAYVTGVRAPGGLAIHSKQTRCTENEYPDRLVASQGLYRADRHFAGRHTSGIFATISS